MTRRRRARTTPGQGSSPVSECRLSAIADLAIAALSDAPLDKLYEEACEAVRETLAAPLVVALDRSTEAQGLHVRARAGTCGDGDERALGAAVTLQASCALRTGRTMVSDDLSSETRFAGAALVERFQLRSGVSVLIGAAGEASGVLAAYARAPRAFADVDVDFLEQVAHILARGMTRQRASDTELELARNRQRLQIALDAAELGTWALDIDQDRAKTDTRHDRIFGYDDPPADWGFDVFLDHVMPEDRERVEESFRGAVAEKRDWHFECRIRRRDGQIRQIEAHGRHVGGAGGEASMLLGTVADVTERRAAEHDLGRVGKFLDLVMSSAKVARFSWNPQTDEASWDESLDLLLGVPPDAPRLGATFFERVHPDDLDDLRQAIEATIERGAPYDAEFRIIRPDGAVRWLAGRGQMLTQADGSSLLVGVDFDVTDMRVAEQALRASEERFKLAMEATADLVYDWNLETGTVQRSAGMVDIIGVAPEKAGEDRAWWVDRIHPEDRRRVVESLDAALGGGGEHYEQDYRVRHGNGHWVHVADRGRIIRDAGGRAVRVVGSRSDITEAKQAEQRQRVMIAELDHRVKNILANISAVAAQSVKSGECVEQFVRGLQGRIQALGVAHELLSQTRWQGASIRRLVEEETAPFAGRARISIAGPDFFVKPNAAQSFAMALHELVTNALKYGSLSSSDGRVAIEWSAPEDVVEPIVFTWCESDGPAVKPPARGGFGTTILTDIVTQEWDAEVTMSYPETGLVCRMIIPQDAIRLASSAGPGGGRRRPAAPRGQDVPAGSPVVLVIEDSGLLAQATSSALAELGMVAAGPAKTQEEANRHVDEGAFDAAIVDLNLNGVIATGVVEKLMRSGKPFVVATGYEPTQVLPAHLRPERWFRKPVEAGVLAAAIGEMLRLPLPTD